MPDVFVSYTHKNSDVAMGLCQALEERDIACWIAPRDIAPGSPWAESIVTGIGASRAMVALISRDAYRSEQMAHELERADSTGLPIIPVRLDDAPLEGQFQYYLGNKQWLDLNDGSTDNLSRIVEAVRKLPDRKSKPGLQPSTGTGHRPIAAWAPRASANALVAEIRLVVRTFVSVTMKREKVLTDVDLAEKPGVFFAARYLIYLSIAAVLLHIPVWSAQGISYGHPAFFLSMVAAELIEGVALCFAFYAAFRTFGADVEPQRFFSAFCVLSSFRLMASICLEPIRSRALSLQSTNIDEVASRISVIGSQVAGGELVVLTSAFAATIVLWCLFVGALLRGFNVTAQLGRPRAALSLLAGIGIWVGVILVFSQPFEARVYEAFARR